MKVVHKILIFLFSTFIIGSCKKETEIIVFQDYNFLNTLIKAGIDSNHDGSICFAEAGAVKSLNLNGKQISDLTAIGSFVNLEKLECGLNQLTTLDLSGNSLLKSIDCIWNAITQLNLSKNTDLQVLICDENQITTLLHFNNPDLKRIDCSNNRITQLNLAANSALTYLPVNNNALTDLNISNNILYENILLNYYSAYSPVIRFIWISECPECQGKGLSRPYRTVYFEIRLC